MARVSHREKVQLGYSPKSSLHRPISLPKISSRNSDTDFSDVFGGPPRRSSMHENSLNSYKSNDDNEQELWSDFDENPVFGDEIGGRRRYKSGDFFDDIFGGDQSVSSSPRMAGRNPFASNPGSRVLSPARTLPPRAEPLGSTAQYSLPARLANVDSLVPTAVKRRPYGNNNGAVRIAYSSGANMSRFSCQTNPNHDASLVDSCSSIHQSSLSHELSTSSGKETKNMSFDGAEARPSYDAYSKGGEISKDGRQFHFSIYKWARKGVPLRMSPRRNALKSIENGKICRSLNLNGNADSDTLATEIHMADMPDKDTVPFNMIDMASTSGMNYSDEDECLADYSKPQEIVDTSQYFDAAIRSLSKSKSHDSIENKNKQDPIDIKLHHEEETISFLLKTVLFDKADKKIPNIAMDTEKSSLLEQTKGNMEAEKENMAKPKGHLMDDVISSHKEVRKDRLHGSFRDAKRSTGKKGVEGNTGKVKEFVKIFNQESPLKPQIRFSGQSRSCRWRDSNSFNVEIEAKSTSMKMRDESQAPDMNPGKTSSKASVKGSNAHGNSIPSRNRKSGLDSRHNMFETDSTWKENLAECSGSEPEILTAPIPSITVTSQDDILIREFLEGLEKPSKDFEREEEIKESEIKILQWSKGKEGNIRALLSTLQCVLWANSGWKPVALVDIIEANSVKRAYQKALLCLHPDKLQQKGAASQQKFIAEKVFDILQAAWDHFNSLGGL